MENEPQSPKIQQQEESKDNESLPETTLESATEELEPQIEMKEEENQQTNESDYADDEPSHKNNETVSGVLTRPSIEVTEEDTGNEDVATTREGHLSSAKLEPSGSFYSVAATEESGTSQEYNSPQFLTPTIPKKLQKTRSQKSMDVTDDDDDLVAEEEPKTARSDDSFGSVGSGTYVSPVESPRPITAPDDSQTREYLSNALQEANLQHSRLSRLNEDLHRKLAQFFKNQKDDDHVDKVSENEKYLRALDELDTLIDQLRNMRSYYDSTMQEMKSKYNEKWTKANEIRESFVQFKREIGKASENSKTGKPLSDKKTSQYEQEELARDRMIEKVRLKHINLRKKYNQLEKKEELKNGLHVIDFEQLKIENQTFTEKIEERNNELQKLRKKITSTVHMVSHVKEKLQFVQEQNADLKKILSGLEGQVVSQRDSLGNLKQERDVLRAENMEQKQKSGLLGSNDLLRDFEKRRDELAAAHEELRQLQDQHNALVEKIDRLKKQQQNQQTLESMRSELTSTQLPETAGTV